MGVDGAVQRLWVGAHEADEVGVLYQERLEIAIEFPPELGEAVHLLGLCESVIDEPFWVAVTPVNEIEPNKSKGMNAPVCKLGISSIHSAVESDELYATCVVKFCPVVLSVIAICH